MSVEGQDERALNKRQRAELQALRDNQQRLIAFDGGAELMAWADAHKLHKDEPYIGCLFCRDGFVPKAALVESEARERELENERDEARAIRDHRLAADPVVDGHGWKSEHLRPRPGELEIYIDMARSLKADNERLRDPEAVLVEALKGHAGR